MHSAADPCIMASTLGLLHRVGSSSWQIFHRMSHFFLVLVNLLLGIILC
jgi:hypothetical protein